MNALEYRSKVGLFKKKKTICRFLQKWNHFKILKYQKVLEVYIYCKENALYQIFVILYKINILQNSFESKIAIKLKPHVYISYVPNLKLMWDFIYLGRYTTNSHQNSIKCFLMHFYVISLSILLLSKITTKYGILRLIPFQRYVFCQDYKTFWF